MQAPMEGVVEAATVATVAVAMAEAVTQVAAPIFSQAVAVEIARMEKILVVAVAERLVV